MALIDKLTAIADGFRSSRGITDTLTLDEMAALAAEDWLDVNIVEYDQVNSQAAAYLNAAKSYTDSDRSTTVMSNYLSTTTGYDDPVGQAITPGGAGTLYVVDESTGFTVREAVSAATTTKTIYNLIPGHIYQWFVKDSSGKVISSGRLKPTGTLRMVKFLYQRDNLRDLGGWACDGGTVKYGLMIRGGFLGETALDLDNQRIARYVGIKHEVDLRYEGDLTFSPLGSDVRYVRYPLTADTYVGIIDGTDAASRQNIVSALKTIFDAVVHNETCYFHCSLGADRCGTTAWMVEALLGMSPADMDKDYELTTFHTYPFVSGTRYRTASTYQALYTYINSLPGSTFIEKIVYWYIKAGFTIDELNAFRSAAIDGTPAVLVSPIYSVTNNLTNCTSNNSVTSVDTGASYTATITPIDAYMLDAVTVTMGGTDITSTAYSNGVITIGNVTGDIVITVSAVKIPTYTNLVPTAKTANGGTEIFNGTGYKDGTYVSGSNANPTTSDSPVTSTGFIALPTYNSTSLPTIYIKGISMDYSTAAPYRRCRVYFNVGTSTKETQVFSGSEYWVVTKISDKYHSLSPTTACYSNYGMFTSFRVSGVGYGKDLIVTVNQPIE